MTRIKTYDSPGFTQRYMTTIGQTGILKPDFDKFFIVQVEEMYKTVTRQVPATRSTLHTCLYLTSGTATMKIGSDSYTISKGEMLFVPAGQVFSFGPGDINKGYLSSFHPDMLIGSAEKKEVSSALDFLKVWGYPKIILDRQTSGFVLHIFKRLLLEYRTEGMRHTSLLRSYLFTLLNEVNIAYRSVQPPAIDSQTGIANKFRELLVLHIGTEHRVTDYASRLSITPNHLNKVVKAATGKSPTRWIDEAIIAEAKMLLYQSDMSIAEVASTVGISDAAYFSRLFKKYEGTTPNTYRRRIEKS